ncbi:CD1375 family protein [Paenibacillus whitsoniae]|nr:CD1375 family protein [Paenibacillus whitsoniae]
MVTVYVTLLQKGLKTLQDVPVSIRYDAESALSAANA